MTFSTEDRGGDKLQLRQDLSRLLNEQCRQDVGFLAGLNIDNYIDKIIKNADLETIYDGERLLGCVAWYGNDILRGVAYITIILVALEARGSGLGARLMEEVLHKSVLKGFHACELEVFLDNAPALTLYKRFGFCVAEDRGSKLLMRLKFAANS